MLFPVFSLFRVLCSGHSHLKVLFLICKVCSPQRNVYCKSCAW